jgi:conjugative transfer signal peptidase TraF
LKARSSSLRAGWIRRALTLGAAGVLVGSIVAAVVSLHLTLNRTPSMPIGLYRALALDRAPRRGDVVLACAPERLARLGRLRGFLPPGDCPGHTAPLLKRIAAAGDDVVELREDAVVVNGVPLPESATRPIDSGGRPLSHLRRGRYVLRAGEVWLWAPSPRRWDSRYYGPLPECNIRAFALPFAILPQR